MPKREKPRPVLTGEWPGAYPNGGPRPSAGRVLDLIDTSDPAWPDIAAALRELKAAGTDLDESSVARAVELGRQRAALTPAPGTAGAGEAVTAEEAESELGIKRGTLRAWVHRGLIKAAGRDGRGRDYFRKDQLTAIRDSTATRIRRTRPLL